jgi:hypothetical protein
MKGVAMQVALAVTVVQWLVFVAGSFASRAKAPKTGLRPAERNLLLSSVVLAGMWLVLFGMRGGAAGGVTAPSTATSPAAKAAHDSCAVIDTGMTAAQVRDRLGTADETRSDEATRGPGAVILVYRDSRCAVHLVDDKVELVE